MRGDILMLGLKVLSLHVVGVANVERGLSEGIPVEILRLDGLNVTRISWDLRDAFLLVHWLELVVYFFGNVAESRRKYPVYPGTM